MAWRQTAHLVRGCTEVNKHQAQAAEDRVDLELLSVGIRSYDDKFVRGLSHIQTNRPEAMSVHNK